MYMTFFFYIVLADIIFWKQPILASPRGGFPEATFVGFVQSDLSDWFFRWLQSADVILILKYLSISLGRPGGSDREQVIHFKAGRPSREHSHLKAALVAVGILASSPGLIEVPRSLRPNAT